MTPIMTTPLTATSSPLARAFRASAPREMRDPGPRASRWNTPRLDPALPLRVADVPVATIVREVLSSPHVHRRPDGSATRIPLRPVPSAGAMHPITVHVLVGRGCDLSPGLYAFDAVSGAFFRRDTGTLTTAAFLPQGARIVVTARPQRTWARYGDCAPPLLITEAALTLAWLSTACANHGVVGLWRSDRSANPTLVALPQYSAWQTRWPQSPPELALAVFDVLPSADETVISALNSWTPELASQVRPASAPVVAERHTCHPIDGLDEDVFRHQLTESFTELAFSTTDFSDRRSADIAAFTPSGQRVDASLVDAAGASVEVLDAAGVTRRVHDHGQVPGLADRCSHQPFVASAPSVVVWSAEPDAVGTAPAHWSAGFDAARLTLAAHRGEICGFSRTRLVAGWQHRDGETSHPILGLAFATDSARADGPPIREVVCRREESETTDD